jgi:fission process protein 1
MLSAQRYVAYTSDIGESFRPIAHPYLIKGAYGISWLYLAGDVGHEGYKAYCRNQHTLHPEKFLDEQGNDTTTSGSQGMAKEIMSKVKEVARGVTSTEGVKYGDAGTALTGGQVVGGRIPAIEDYRAVMAQRAVFQAVASMGLPAFTIHSIVRYSGRALKDAKNKTLRTWGPIGVSFCTVVQMVLDEWMLIQHSSVSQPFPSYPTLSTSRSSMPRNGSSTTRSRRLVGRRPLRADRSLEPRS